jgi:cytochrome o ubiquinol oxidase subunit 2
MNILSKGIIFFLIAVNIFLFLYLLVHGKNIAVFNPAGSIAHQERNFLFFALFLGLSIVIPVIVAAYVLVWKYRASNTSAAYTPDWDSNKKVQLICLALLCGVI